MQSNETERRREPRRREDRNATQQVGQQPQAGGQDDDGVSQDVTPSFFRAGEFEIRDPSLPERRSGEDKRKGARKIQLQPDE